LNIGFSEKECKEESKEEATSANAIMQAAVGMRIDDE